jgi:UDP:flavonoid glycosyltransferase YjiC (YdhE family)
MWERLSSCVRKEGSGDFHPPKGDGELVYLSLGSLGSADVELMQRLVDLLAAGGYRAIVSKGPQHDQIELRDGQEGAELVPQPALVPMVDAVITHGGNTRSPSAFTSESRCWCCRSSGTSTTAPSGWTSSASASGCRRSSFEDAERGGAIDKLVADEALRDRLKALSARLQGEPGTERAADCIETVWHREPRARARA